MKTSNIVGGILGKFLSILVPVSAVVVLIGLVYGVYVSIPPAEQVVAMENVRLKKACNSGDTKACQYLKAIEGGVR